MIVLLAFAVLAGAGTALSPCVLPVLPALLAAGGVGGRRRPLGIVIGLSITFTVTIVGVAMVVDGVGLGSDPLRGVAIVVLLVFGVVLLLPDVQARIEAPLSRLARLGPRSTGDGFASGLLVGGALGFVYTPCASPILAAVISVSAASGRTILIALAYALGSALVLLALTLGGRRLFDRVRAAGRGPLLQRVLGTIMILTALAILTNLDVNFDQFVAQHIPDVNLTASLECSSTVTSRLHQITGHEPKFAPANGSSDCKGSATAVHPAARNASEASLVAEAETLPDLGTAPEFTETEKWFNTPGGRPDTLASLQGRVVLVDFWTYTCINCIRTLPYLKAWDAAYRSRGPHDRRRRDPRVRLRARRLERRQRDRPVRAALPGRPGQQHGHVERVRQPVLAGRLPDRHARPGPLHGIRRGRLRADGNRHPRAAGPGRLRGRRQEPSDERGRPLGRGNPRDLPGNGPRAGMGRVAQSGAARLRIGRAGHPGVERLRLQRQLEHLRTARHRRLGRGDRRALPGEERLSRAELARRTPACGARCSSTAGRSPPRMGAPMCTRASSPCAASACTRSCRSRAPKATACRCASRRA